MFRTPYVITAVVVVVLALSAMAPAQAAAPDPQDLHDGSQKAWLLKEYVLDGKTVDIPDYAQDDRFIFTSAGVGMFHAGSVFKDPAMPLEPDAFVWQLEGDRLLITDLESLHPGGKVEQKVVQLTADELVLERDYDQDGKTVVLRQTWVPAPPEVSATQVITFVPAGLPAGDPVQGSCWSNSLAAFGREDAWRCSSDNMIGDPCFQVVGHSDQVVCQPDPIKNDPGFAMQLTEPLPKADIPEAAAEGYANNGWAVLLADGNACYFMTGATFALGDDRANYGCVDGEWYIMGDLIPGTVWQAKLATVTMGDNGAELKDSKTVEIKTVWK
jgi:hypothetical protein